MRFAPVIIGGELSGTLVDSWASFVEVHESAGPLPLYDRSGDTRPFVLDVVKRRLPVQRLGIPVHVVLDGIEEDEAVDALRSLAPHIQALLLAALQRPS